MSTKLGYFDVGRFSFSNMRNGRNIESRDPPEIAFLDFALIGF
jgi:hypothetical protein